MSGALIAGVVIGVLLALILPLVWRHRAQLVGRLTRLPVAAWGVVTFGALAALWYSARRAPSAPAALPPVPSPPPRAPDHADDIPVETPPDPAAPLAPPDAASADDQLRWLEQRARRRSGTSE